MKKALQISSFETHSESFADGLKMQKEYICSKDTMSVPWDILILELKEQNPGSFLSLSGSCVPAQWH